MSAGAKAQQLGKKEKEKKEKKKGGKKKGNPPSACTFRRVFCLSLFEGGARLKAKPPPSEPPGGQGVQRRRLSSFHPFPRGMRGGQEGTRNRMPAACSALLFFPGAA